MMGTLVRKFFPQDQRSTTIAVLSLLGAWIVTVPYEGQILYTLGENFNIDSYELLKASLIMQAIGLLAGGMLLKTMKLAKWTLAIALPFCMLCTGLLFIKSYWVWGIALMACSIAAGACNAACGYFFKLCTGPGRRFSAAISVIIIISFLKLFINLITLYLSLYAGIVLSVSILGLAFYFALRLPSQHNPSTAIRPDNKKKVVQALILLCIFVSVTTIDFGIMIQAIIPQYEHLEWLTSWYWLLPYICAALFMKRLSAQVDRGNMLYIAIGMIGFAFILFLMLEKNIVSYLIVFTLMMGAWAVSDVFWWSMLGEMLDLQKNAAMILGFGFCANVLGVLNGKIIGRSVVMFSDLGTSLLPLAIICVSLMILPLLHRSLTLLLTSNNVNTQAIALTTEPEAKIEAHEVDLLTERERQIVTLLLKGKTCKLIAEALFLSENTVKTHIKNIYAKLGIRKKSELFSRLMK